MEKILVRSRGGSAGRCCRKKDTLVLGLRGMLITLLFLDVAVTSERFIVENELAHFSFLPGHESLVYFSRDSDHTSTSC